MFDSSQCAKALGEFIAELTAFGDPVEYSDGGAASDYPAVDRDHPLHKAACRVQGYCWDGNPLPDEIRPTWKKFLGATRGGATDREDTIEACVQGLLGWAKARGETQADGPRPPCHFWWRGRSYKVAGKRFELLRLLWEADDHTLDKRVIGPAVWGAEWSGTVLSTTIGRLNTDLGKSGCTVSQEENLVRLEVTHL